LYTCSAACPALIAGEWVTLHIFHATKKGMLGGRTHELSIAVNSVEVLRTSEAFFPRDLSAAPLVVARMGEAFDGELGPVYFWGDELGGAPLPAKLQGELAMCHTGDAVALVHRAVTRGEADSPLARPFVQLGRGFWTTLVGDDGAPSPTAARPSPPSDGDGNARHGRIRRPADDAGDDGAQPGGRSGGSGGEEGEEEAGS
jgi:hypothetical protein